MAVMRLPFLCGKSWKNISAFRKILSPPMNFNLQGVLDQVGFAACSSNFNNNHNLINSCIGDLNIPNSCNNLSVGSGGALNNFNHVPQNGGHNVVPNTSTTRGLTTQTHTPSYAKVSTPMAPKVALPAPAPKKPLTAYMLYMKEMRPEVAKKNPTLKVTDVVKKVAEMWQTLDASEKQKYVDKFKLDLERFNVINEAYHKSLTKEQKMAIRQQKNDKRERLTKRRLTTQLRELEKPKGPRSAFSLFLISRLPNRGDLPITEFTKEASEIWKKLPDETKQIYFNNAREDKIRHEREMAEWRNMLEREGHHNVIKAVFKDEKSGGSGIGGGGGGGGGGSSGSGNVATNKNKNKKAKTSFGGQDEDEGREYLQILKYPPAGAVDINSFK